MLVILAIRPLASGQMVRSTLRCKFCACIELSILSKRDSGESEWCQRYWPQHFVFFRSHRDSGHFDPPVARFRQYSTSVDPHGQSANVHEPRRNAGFRGNAQKCHISLIIIASRFAGDNPQTLPFGMSKTFRQCPRSCAVRCVLCRWPAGNRRFAGCMLYSASALTLPR